jgi:organic radical activating enzyme
VKVGKYNLNSHTLNSLYHRHVRRLWDSRLRENSEWQHRFLVLTNNFCTLSCYSCSALCNRPIGSNPFRWQRHVTPLEDIERFLDLIEDYRPEYWIRLSGGETTLCGPEYLEELCEIIHSHGRNVSLLTNGARMQELDPHWFEFIHLDEHIVNEHHIYQTAEYFKEQGYKRFQILPTKVHRDLALQRKDHVSPGLHCEGWMQAISLWRKTVYPCCVLPFLDGWNNDTTIRESLQNAGWFIHNPNLADTMRDWKHTTPPEIVHACALQCWKEGPNVEYHPVSTQEATH